MLQGMVFDIKHYALHDGPGIRTTVFLMGCPLSCWWCHNPESMRPLPGLLLHPERCIECGRCHASCHSDAIDDTARCCHCGACVSACPAEARELVGRTIAVEQVMTELRKDIPFYDQSGGGVTFSGGEPVCQPGFLLALLDHCRLEEIHTVVDTSGYAEPNIIREVAKRTDLFLYDLKHMDPCKHQLLTGVTNDLILENLKRLATAGAKIRIRMPIIPGINDDRTNIDATGSYLASLPGVRAIDILPYHSSAGEKYRKLGLVYRLPRLIPPSDLRMQEVAAWLRSYGLTVRIGG